MHVSKQKAACAMSLCKRVEKAGVATIRLNFIGETKTSSMDGLFTSYVIQHKTMIKTDEKAASGIC